VRRPSGRSELVDMSLPGRPQCRQSYMSFPLLVSASTWWRLRLPGVFGASDGRSSLTTGVHLCVTPRKRTCRGRDEMCRTPRLDKSKVETERAYTSRWREVRSSRGGLQRQRVPDGSGRFGRPVAERPLACNNAPGTPPGVGSLRPPGYRVPPPVCVQRDPGSEYRAGVAS
jgi:hypothetical protein